MVKMGIGDWGEKMRPVARGGGGEGVAGGKEGCQVVWLKLGWVRQKLPLLSLAPYGMVLSLPGKDSITVNTND